MKKLIMVMTATLAVSFSAWAETETVGGYTWTYRINGDTVEIYKNDGHGYGTTAISPSPTGAVTIPSTLGGKPVTGIGEKAFYACNELTNVTIPDSVTSLGGHLFEVCSRLEHVVVGSQVTELSYRMFYGCEMLESVEFKEGALNSIKEDCFRGCVQLRALTLPSNMAVIANHAFDGCSSLRHVTFNKGLKEIGSNAFNDCTGLRWVFFWGDKPTLGSYVFRNVNDKMVVYISETSKGFPVTLEGYPVICRSAPPPDPCTVKFDMNGAPGIPPESREIPWGDELGELKKTNLWEGHTFEGWFTAPSGGTEVTDTTEVTDDITYYAHWTANSYTVTFNANGGTGATMANESFTYDVAKALTANAFSRTGYTYQGWATSADGDAAYADRQTVSNLTAAANGTVNLYAVWKANTYTVTFNANGGTGTMANESFTYDVAKALTANAFNRTGYTYQGWATSADGDAAYADRQTVSNLTAAANGTVNLYAVWKAIVVTHTVTFNANGGSVSPVTRAVKDGAAVGALPEPVCEGYTFDGWFTAPSGGTKIDESTKITGNVTYYAHWTEIVVKYGGVIDDVSFSKAQTKMGALYDAKGNLVGTVELKFGKKGKKGVKISASATMIIGGKSKKISAKAVTLGDGETRKTLTFKDPIGEMMFVMGADGVFTLKGSGYEMVGAIESGATGRRALPVGGVLSDRTMHFNVAMDSVPDFGKDGALLDEAFPVNEPVHVAGGKWSFDKVSTPKYKKNRETGAYELLGLDDPAKPNVSGLKLSYTAKTGVFKGSFKLYATNEATTPEGKSPKLKKFTVNVIGLVVDGVGVGQASLKKPAASWAVTVK